MDKLLAGLIIAILLVGGGWIWGHSGLQAYVAKQEILAKQQADSNAKLKAENEELAKELQNEYTNRQILVTDLDAERQRLHNAIASASKVPRAVPHPAICADQAANNRLALLVSDFDEALGRLVTAVREYEETVAGGATEAQRQTNTLIACQGALNICQRR